MLNLLKAHEAAKMLQISTRTLARLVNTGQIARIKMKKSVRYRHQDLEEYLRYTRQKPFARKEDRLI